MGTIIKVIILIVILCVVGYIGLSFWSSCSGPDNGAVDLPDKKEATHSFYIKNTGGLILSSDYEQHGEEVGKRLFMLHGYWELRGKSFKFIEGDITLNEAIFGEITVKRRTK